MPESATSSTAAVEDKLGSEMSKVPNVPVKIDEQDIQTGAREVLRVVRPLWLSRNGESKIQFKVFTDGLSNKLVGFYEEGNKEDMVIVKVFGTNTDAMIDRKAEIETMRILHERKCGAEVYATFDNGICYQFMNGITLGVDRCRDPRIVPLVAAEMARMHSGIRREICTNGASHPEKAQQLNGSNGVNGHYSITETRKTQLWNKMKQFNQLAEDIMATDKDLRQRLANVGVHPGWASGAISDLESMLESQNMPVTFCHNDINPHNIVFDEKRGKVTFIDVEYAMYNYPAFDVANHFLEFAGIDNVDYTKCPDEAFRRKWIQEYLKHLSLEEYPESISVDRFDFWVQLCTPAIHLFWGLWSIYQARHSTIKYDYASYTGLRFSEFRKLIDHLRTAVSQRNQA